jgi:hypothetical protein
MLKYNIIDNKEIEIHLYEMKIGGFTTRGERRGRRLWSSWNLQAPLNAMSDGKVWLAGCMKRFKLRRASGAKFRKEALYSWYGVN